MKFAPILSLVGIKILKHNHLFFFYKFIYLFIFGCIGSLLLRGGFLFSCGERGLLFVAVRRLLIAVASLVVEHGLQVRVVQVHVLQQLWHMGSVVVAQGLSSCGSRALELRLSSCSAQAQLLRGMWDLPGPGLKPVSPALAGRFLTTESPGKPETLFF